MNCISLWQPWASAIAVGVKTIETRSWPAPKSAIGKPIAIHAAKRYTNDLVEYWRNLVQFAHSGEAYALFQNSGYTSFESLPKGKVVAIATLVDCVSTNDDPPEHLSPRSTDEAWGDFSINRYAWILRDVRPLASPVPVIGRQGMFQWDAVDAVPA